jgi:broad specificity phosphatase PhoE
VRRRVLAAWEIILAENKDEITIIVAHSGVLNQLLIHLFGKNFPKGERYYRIRPCAISEFTMSDDGQAHLVRLDDVSHLSDYQ